LGILGGTFDPVHIGHLVLGESAREELDLDRVLFIPASVQWRKGHRKVTEPHHRLEMLRLAIVDNPAFEVSEVEIERGGPSYTVETLEELRRTRPAADLYFIVGEDALADLPNWREPERIVRLARLVVAARRVDAPAQAKSEYAEGAVRLMMPLLEISSTDIRRRVGAGRSIRYLVPPLVEAYIRRNNLYQTTGGHQRA
jgi:nicotinate-nucleotide adenylyltransferase